MKKFNIPCLFHGSIKSAVRIYIGEPHPEFTSLCFQEFWLRTIRHGEFPEATLASFKKLQEIALKNRVIYEDLVEYALSKAENASNPNTAAPKTSPAAGNEKKEIASSAKAEVPANPLCIHWDKLRQDKWRIVSHITSQIMKASSCRSLDCKRLLAFLLSVETKNLPNLLSRMEYGIVFKHIYALADLSYSICVIADTEGMTMNYEALSGFRQYLRKPCGDQLLALIELRNALERWAMLPDESTPRTPYDLTALHGELHQYFLPQQWTGKRKPTPEAMYKFAWQLERGEGGVKSLLGAIAWTHQAASSGLSDAQVTLGYWFGKCGDGKRFKEWTEKAARKGNGQALFNLGVDYREGKNGRPNDYAIALKYFQKAFNCGHQTAMSEIGNCYMKGNKIRDYKKAKAWFEKAIQASDDQYACYSLAKIYENGWGEPKSAVKAVKYYRKAAGKGHAAAQYRLGEAYRIGDGVKLDVVEAVKWYQKAAENGNTDAQCKLGDAYKNGEGVEMNGVEAVNWYRKAAEYGYAPAQCKLGDAYKTGKGITMDRAAAIDWYRKAAKQRDVTAKNNLKALEKD